MPYVIKVYRGDKVIKQTAWVGKFTLAKEHAKDNFPIHAKKSGATRVEVWDADSDNLMFHHPGFLRPR